ncbi:MAG: hypothetical protein ACOY44_03730 [Pseudomonadota bacterium]
MRERECPTRLHPSKRNPAHLFTANLRGATAKHSAHRQPNNPTHRDKRLPRANGDESKNRSIPMARALQVMKLKMTGFRKILITIAAGSAMVGCEPAHAFNFMAAGFAAKGFEQAQQQQQQYQLEQQQLRMQQAQQAQQMQEQQLQMEQQRLQVERQKIELQEAQMRLQKEQAAASAPVAPAVLAAPESGDQK